MKFNFRRRVGLILLLLSVLVLFTGIFYTNDIKYFIHKVEYNKDKFNYIHKRFMVYNKDIDSSTTMKFMEVVDTFDLDSTQRMLDIFISQICLESGAKHSDDRGELILSKAHAIGITQIVPSTALLFLKGDLPEMDRGVLRNLGCTDYDFVNDGLSDKKLKSKLIEWLSIEENNLILWGYIMRYSIINNDYKINRALIEYNAGTGFLRRYIDEGNNVNEFSYVVMIRNIMVKFKSDI
jgi:hypothetical protein